MLVQILRPGASRTMGETRDARSEAVLGTNSVHGRAQQLGKLYQLGMGPALRDGIPGHDQGTFGARQDFGGGLHRIPIAAQAWRDACGGEQIDIGVGPQDIAGKREEYGSRGGRESGLHRAVNQSRQILEPVHFRGPFYQRARYGGQVRPEDGLGSVEALLVLPGCDQNGRARLLRVVEHAHCIAEARRDMQVHHAKLA